MAGATLPAMATPPINVPPVLPGELLPLDGTDWNVVAPVRTVDGDTVRVRRQQLTWTLLDECEIGDSLVLEEWRLRVVRDDETELPDGLAARLVNLDTPELRSKDPAERERAKLAAADLTLWFELHAGRVRCISYDEAGGFDRLLIDLYVLAEDGTIEETASQWMLKRDWAPYVRAA